METDSTEGAGAASRADKRTAHCREQAAECALGATTAMRSEIKEAYLHIEQAWLQLAPEIDSGRTGSLRKR